VRCNGRLITVPGIGDDGAAMSLGAAAWRLENSIPPVSARKPQKRRSLQFGLDAVMSRTRKATMRRALQVRCWGWTALRT